MSETNPSSDPRGVRYEVNTIQQLIQLKEALVKLKRVSSHIKITILGNENEPKLQPQFSRYDINHGRIPFFTMKEDRIDMMFTVEEDAITFGIRAAHYYVDTSYSPNLTDGGVTIVRIMFPQAPEFHPSFMITFIKFGPNHQLDI